MRKVGWRYGGLAVFLLLFAACQYDYPPSLFDPNEKSKPQPVVTEVIPPDSAYAGVGTITIRGRNFSPKPEENLVFFNAQRAEVLQASETELVVKTPNLVADSILIKIAVHGAELFSEPVRYKLVAAVSEHGKLLEGEVAFGIAADREGNIFVSIEGKRIKKITPAGKTSIFTNTTFLRANSMKMGPGDTLYAATAAGRARIIQTISPDGVGRTFVSLPGNPRDFDFDADGNIWVSAFKDIYLVRPDGSRAKADSYPVDIEAVRVFEGYLYVGGKDELSGEAKIWRSPIQGETLGEKEVFLDLAAANWLEGADVLSLTFAKDGTLYLGTNHPKYGIFVVNANKEGEPLYPGLIEPQVYAMTWPAGNAIFAVVQFPGGSKIIKVNVGKEGAPYYGRR